MKAMTKGQILKYTYCRFYLWHTSIDCCHVVKKALKNALRSNKTYSVEVTEQKFEHGRNAGKSYYNCIILL